MKRILAVILAALFIGLTVEAQQPFAKVEVEPATLYAGQPFTIRLSLYLTGQDLEGMQLAGIPPQLQLQPFEEMATVSETIGGHAYQVVRSRCEAVSPAPGVLRFTPLIQGIAVRTVQTLFLVQHVRSQVRIEAPAFDLTVKPIPLDRAPAGYAGLIGSFSLEAAASTNRVLPGDLVTLTFTIAGRGRFDLLPRLGYDTVPGFKVYPIRDDKARSGARARTTTQVVIPQAPESLSLPALTLVAFNPERESFDTLAAGPFRFTPDSDRPKDQPPPVYLNGGEESPEAAKPRALHPAPSRWPGDPALASQADALFKAGAEAYAANRLAEAIDAYSKLLALGIRAPEVDLNLGAACAGAGRRGKAMVFLLRAARAAPRDPLAREHLADARHPRFPPRLPAWSRLGPGEWRGAAAALFLFSVLLAALGRRRAAARLAAVPVLGLAAVCAAGLLWWRNGPPRTERVITAPAVQGRLAPAPSAAPTLRLEEGAAVRLLETAGDWNRVEAGGVTAWIPSSTFEKP